MPSSSTTHTEIRHLASAFQARWQPDPPHESPTGRQTSSRHHVEPAESHSRDLVGSQLARLEIRVVLEAMLARFSGFELAGVPEWMPNNRLVGLKYLPVRPVLA